MKGFKAAKAQSWAERLFRAARRVNELATRRLEEKGVPIRPAHTALFAHIDVDGGSRLTEIARRMGVSKQAVAPLADELVSLGVLERVADPSDRRARRLCFSETPGRGLMDGLAVLQSVERELEAHLRSNDGDRLVMLLDRVLGAVERIEERTTEQS